MKNLFFVAVASGIFSGTITSVKAQTSVHPERLTGKVLQSILPKFIEGIEISQQRSFAVLPMETEMVNIPAVLASNPVVASSMSIEDCSKLQFKYALLLEKDVESINNFALYNFIDDWWGTRYRYGGADRNGIDCSSFSCKLVADVYGLKVPRTAKEQFDSCYKLSMTELKEGDLVFFNTRGGVSHVGVYLGDGYFVHSSVHDGVTISSLTDAYYGRKYISGGRIKCD